MSKVRRATQLRRVWTAAADQGQFGAFVRFLPLSTARRGEAAWGELDGADWILPTNRNKVKVDLVRPLSQAAQAILAEQPRIAGCSFPFTCGGRRALASFSQLKQNLDAVCGVTSRTLQDLRRTAGSLLSRAGVYPDVAQRCLGHVIKGVRATYDRHEYYAQKLHAFEALAGQIERRRGSA
jgi:integrase